MSRNFSLETSILWPVLSIRKNVRFVELVEDVDPTVKYICSWSKVVITAVLSDCARASPTGKDELSIYVRLSHCFFIPHLDIMCSLDSTFNRAIQYHYCNVILEYVSMASLRGAKVPALIDSELSDSISFAIFHLHSHAWVTNSLRLTNTMS